MELPVLNQSAQLLRHIVDVRRFILQQANDRRAEGFLELPRQPEQHRIRKANNVRTRLGFQPVDELRQLARLMAGLAAQHRESDFANVRSIRFPHPTGGQMQQPLRPHQPMHPIRRVAI